MSEETAGAVRAGEVAAAEELELVPLREAARRLDVSADTIRRRLKSGELHGEQRRTRQGNAWFVAVPAESPSSPARKDAPLSAAEREELVQLRERVSGLERVLEVHQRETSNVREERDVWRQRALDGDEAQRQLRVLLAQSLDAGEEKSIAAETVVVREEPEEFEDFLARQSRQEPEKSGGLFGWLRGLAHASKSR